MWTSWKMVIFGQTELKPLQCFLAIFKHFYGRIHALYVNKSGNHRYWQWWQCQCRGHRVLTLARDTSFPFLDNQILPQMRVMWYCAYILNWLIQNFQKYWDHYKFELLESEVCYRFGILFSTFDKVYRGISSHSAS